MAEGMETKNFLLENETTKGRHHTFKKSLLGQYMNFFLTSPQKVFIRMQSVKKLAINIRCCTFLVLILILKTN
jgi:hypothetical protein